MSRGIFRLKQVYEEQLSGQWSTRGDVWLTPSPFSKAHPFGYFAGGSPQLSGVRRLNFSNDTTATVPKGPLSVGRYHTQGTSSVNFGYVGGGNPGPKSTIERIDYTNDTATPTEKGPLSGNKYFTAATGNSAVSYTHLTLPTKA